MVVDEINLAVRDFKDTVKRIRLFELGREYRKFKYFPQACCVITSHLISRFLIRRFPHIHFEVICGTPNGYPHYWVEGNGKVIDITMSQKGISLSDIIYSESKWHRGCRILATWDVTHEFQDVNEGADCASSSVLETGYKLIVSNIRAADEKV